MTNDQLTRFREGYDADHAHALAEIEAGRKRSHWMWYVFPQVAGLGTSAMARRHAISSMNEAESFLRDPVLGPAYCRLVDAVWRQVVTGGRTVRALFGAPDDAKLVSSLTLFAGAAQRLPGAELAAMTTQAAAVLDAATGEGLPRCGHTLAFLLEHDAPASSG